MSTNISAERTARLKIAVQKSGRLTEHSMELLSRCGLSYSRGRDQLICYGENMPIDVLLVRDDDIPGLVHEGVCDLGIVGHNVIEEARLEFLEQGQANPFAQLAAARDAERKTDLGQIQRALELYYDDYGEYPPQGSNYQISTFPWGQSWSPYMEILPSDPVAAQRYVYTVDPGGQWYRLYAHMERSDDPQMCLTTGADCPNVPGVNLCGVSTSLACNYGVTSPNTSP